MTEEKAIVEFNPTTVRYNADAEQAMIGGLLIACTHYLPQVKTIIAPKDIYTPKHRWVYEAILAIDKRGDVPDYVTIADQLHLAGHLEDMGGVAYLTGFINQTPNALNTEIYAAVVKREAVLRQQIEEAQEAISRAMQYKGDDPKTLIGTLVTNMLSIGRGADRTRVYTLDEGLAALEKQQHDQTENDGEIEGIDPVLPSLRRALWGGKFLKGSIALIGAGPGIGKSMDLLFMAVYNVVVHGLRGMYVGTEMPIEFLMMRIAPMIAYYVKEEGLTSSVLEQGEGEDLVKVIRQICRERLADRALVIVDNATTVEQFITMGQAEISIFGELDFIVLDYLQQLDTEEADKFNNSVQVQSYISNEVRKFGLDSRATLICASSFTKGTRYKLPTIDRFRGAFTIAHDASVMIGMYENKQLGQKCIVLVKIRNEKPGSNMLMKPIPFMIDPDTGIIKELAEEAMEDEIPW